jgi:hypothetical protein
MVILLTFGAHLLDKTMISAVGWSSKQTSQITREHVTQHWRF